MRTLLSVAGAGRDSVGVFILVVSVRQRTGERAKSQTSDCGEEYSIITEEDLKLN